MCKYFLLPFITFGSIQYPALSNAYTVIMCLVVGWFLVYIYAMIGCTYLYEHLKSTRFRFFLRCYAHEERNDALMNYIANG